MQRKKSVYITGQINTNEQKYWDDLKNGGSVTLSENYSSTAGYTDPKIMTSEIIDGTFNATASFKAYRTHILGLGNGNVAFGVNPGGGNLWTLTNITTSNAPYESSINGLSLDFFKKNKSVNIKTCKDLSTPAHIGSVTLSNVKINFAYTLKDYSITLIDSITKTTLDTISYDAESVIPLPTKQDKPGYTFRGWSESENGTPNLNVQINSGTTGNKTYYAIFEPQIKTIIGRTEPANVGSVVILKNLEDKNNKEITYEDNYYFDEIKVNYNNKDYEFKGWKYGNGTSLDDSIKNELVLRNIKLSHEDALNEYIAVFEQINYSINVYMYNDDGNMGIFGELVTDHVDDKSNISESEVAGRIQLSNLKFGDERKLTIVPYRKSIDSQYYFNGWSEKGDMILPVKIDDSWTTNVDDRTIYFNSFNLQNSVTNSEEDSIVVNTIIEKTINDFILKNQVNFLGAYGFYDCKNLKYLYMPGANSIGDHTFENCLELRQVVISSNRDGQIGIDTFKNCSKLNLLILPGNFVALNSLFSPLDDPNAKAEDYPGISPSLFGQKIGRIYVNPDFIDDYKESTTNWGIYSDIIFEINDKIYQGD